MTIAVEEGRTMVCAVRVSGWVVACGILASVVACSRHQSPAPAARSGSAPPPADRMSATARQVLAWLPSDQPVAGWKRIGAVQAFGPDELWESIDGGAETYLTFGFQELVTQACASAAGAEATIEVYRMSDGLNAYGVYAQERNPTARFVATGAEGYLSQTVLNFWHGPYYVKITAAKPAAALADSLLDLATAISARMGAADPQPQALRRFPERDLVAHSIKYLPRDVLGQSYFADGFEAQYRVGGKAFRLVTAAFETAQDAAEGLERYRAFLAASGGSSRALSSPGDSAFAASDRFNGPILAVRSGRVVVFTLGAPSERAGLDLIAAFLAKER